MYAGDKEKIRGKRVADTCKGTVLQTPFSGIVVKRIAI